MKLLLKILSVFLVLGILAFVLESLLQPRVRVVPLEGVPVTTGAPDVTFMLGANMDPLIQTNPFLVIFSPIERMTDKTRVLPGSLNTLSDSAAVFGWEAFGIQTAWHLDRHSQDMTPLFIRPPNSSIFICSRIFPMISSAISRQGLVIRKGPRPGVVEAGAAGRWTEMEPRPLEGALWPVKYPG